MYKTDSPPTGKSPVNLVLVDLENITGGGEFLNTYNPRNDANTALFVMHCIILTLGIMFNFLLLILVLLSRKLQSVQGVRYVFNLSCANMLFSVLALLVGISSRFGSVLTVNTCKILSSTTTFSCLAASFSRAIVALDRYVYISDPLHYYLWSTDRTVNALIACLWIASIFVTSAPYVAEYFFLIGSTTPTCLPIPAPYYNLCILLVGALLPTFFEVFVYTRIFYWACLHIQIMKQEVYYSNQLRQRNVKDAYNVDIRQLELFTRASFLMASAVFSISATDNRACRGDDASEIDDPLWMATLKRRTGISTVTSYFNSMFKESVTTVKASTPTLTNDETLDAPADKMSPVDKRLAKFALYRPQDSGTALDRESTHVSIKEQSEASIIMPISSLNCKRPEDAWVEEELRRLSKKVEAASNAGIDSPAVTVAIGRLLTCTEMKAGLILLIILGTSVGCWVPFLIFTISQLAGSDESSLYSERKVANLFVYTLSSLDPIVYDLLHQPIRTAVKEELRQSLINKDMM